MATVRSHNMKHSKNTTLNQHESSIGELCPNDDETLVHHKVIPAGFGK